MKRDKPKFRVIESECCSASALDPNTYIEFLKCLIQVSKSVEKENKKEKKK